MALLDGTVPRTIAYPYHQTLKYADRPCLHITTKNLVLTQR